MNIKKTIFLAGSLLALNSSIAQDFELISSSNTKIGVEHNYQTRQLVNQTINGVSHINFSKTFDVTTSKKGAPELPYFSKSVLLPDLGEATLELLEANYTEISNVDVTPSKGSLKRNVTPSSIAYEFGEEYNTNAFFPANIAELGSPYILRNTRGVGVSFYPYQYNPVTKTLRVYESVSVNILVNGEVAGESEITFTKPQNDVFYSIYKDHYLNANTVEAKYTPVSEEGDMLVIAASNFMDEAKPLVDWKNQKGIRTELVDVSDAGSSDTQIKSYITNYYASHPNLKYILFVGDHNYIPSHSYGTSGYGETLWSDTYYAQLAGGNNDFYPEVFIGRLTGVSSRITTQVDRILEYEKTPAAGDWMTKAIGLASDEGNGYGDDGEPDWQHARNNRAKLLNFGYTEVYEFYDGSHGGDDAPGNPSSTTILPAVNNGVGLFNYTGHGDLNTCITGNFSSSHINQATNNGKYPLVVSVACNNGTFTTGTCISETWVYATNSGSPSGAIAACGSSILMAWSEPMQTQDEMAAIISEEYAGNKKESIGGIFYNSQMSMLEDYNSNTNAKEVMQTWVMFGDPSTTFRTKTTNELEVSHFWNVPMGTSNLNVTCNTEDALVSVSQNNVFLGSAKVSGGSANVQFDALTSNHHLIVTVTKQNYKAYQANVTVADGSAGIEELSNSNFSVYPNPAKDLATVKWENNAPTTVQLLDLSGKIVVEHTNANKQVQINTSKLDAGLYIVSIEQNGQTITKKLIVK